MRESLLLGTVGQKAEVADAHEAFGQHVKQESANKFLDINNPGLLLVSVSAIPVAESNLSVLDFDDAVIGQSYSVGIAAEVIEDFLWRPKGLFGIDHPFPFTQLFEP